MRIPTLPIGQGLDLAENELMEDLSQNSLRELQLQTLGTMENLRLEGLTSLETLQLSNAELSLGDAAPLNELRQLKVLNLPPAGTTTVAQSLAMASSEQKLISCVGFAHRVAKRMHLIEVGVHLDRALVLLAGVKPKRMPATMQRYPSQPIEVNSSAVTPTQNEHAKPIPPTSGNQLMQSMCLNALANVQRVEDLVESRIQQYMQQCEETLEKLRANSRTQVEQTEAINRLKGRIQQLEAQPLSQLTPGCQSSQLKDPGREVGENVALPKFLLPMDACSLRCVSVAHSLRFGPPKRHAVADVAVDCSSDAAPIV
eukprot:Skav224566  [mRNA]  locus=scaffold4295:146668:153302:- [translate_table: standard]